MSYLKIFPRSLIVKKNGVGGYIGKFFYDFEQYGCMIYSADAEVNLECRCDLHLSWSIQLTSQVHNVTGFSVFMHAMNHYLFEVLKFDPVSQWSKVSAADFEYYFDRVCFDMDAQQFCVSEKTSIVDDKLKILEKIRS